MAHRIQSSELWPLHTCCTMNIVCHYQHLSTGMPLGKIVCFISRGSWNEKKKVEPSRAEEIFKAISLVFIWSGVFGTSRMGPGSQPVAPCHVKRQGSRSGGLTTTWGNLAADQSLLYYLAIKCIWLMWNYEQLRQLGFVLQWLEFIMFELNYGNYDTFHLQFSVTYLHT